jgi:hypothetical protein
MPLIKSIQESARQTHPHMLVKTFMIKFSLQRKPDSLKVHLKQQNSSFSQNLHKTVTDIDGQYRLVRLICLHTDNFHLFLRQQTDKRQTFAR